MMPLFNIAGFYKSYWSKEHECRKTTEMYNPLPPVVFGKIKRAGIILDI
jgi:hypothetical protein